MVPSKLDLLGLARRARYGRTQGAPEPGRRFPLDDPAGEVGIEFIFVTDGTDGEGTTYSVPLTYRGAPLPRRSGAGRTSEHGVLGRRWIYDARTTRSRSPSCSPSSGAGRGAGPERERHPRPLRSSGTGIRRGVAAPRPLRWTAPGAGTTVAVELADPSSAQVRRPCISSACWTARRPGTPSARRGRLDPARRLHRSRGGVGPVAGRPAPAGPRTGRRACRPPRAAGAGRAATSGSAASSSRASPPTRAGAIDRSSSSDHPDAQRGAQQGRAALAEHLLVPEPGQRVERRGQVDVVVPAHQHGHPGVGQRGAASRRRPPRR